MAIQPVPPPIARLSLELLDNIASFCQPREVGRLAATNNSVHTALDQIKINAERRNFFDRYGAIADCEKDSVKTLSERAKLIEDCSDGHWLPFIYKSRLVASDFNKLSYFEQFAKKYRFYRGHYDVELRKIAQSRLDQITQIKKEFLSTPLNPEHPLQDLRDRYKRFNSFVWGEIDILNRAFSEDSYTQGLSWFEYTVFTIVSFFHSIFQSNSRLESIEKNRHDDNPITDLTDILDQKAHVFSEIDIKLEEDRKETTVEIVGTLGGYGCLFTTFLIRNKETKARIGEMILQKFFQRDDQQANFDESDGKINDSKIKLSNPALIFKIIFASSDNEPHATSFPITRLLIQVAMEVYSREPNIEYLGSANVANNYVFAAAGFGSRNEISSKLLTEIQQARKESNQLFPMNNLAVDPETWVIGRLDKLRKKLHNNKTNFIKYGGLVLVNFELDNNPITWEEFIAKRPLIPGKGPVMPNFVVNNPYNNT